MSTHVSRLPVLGVVAAVLLWSGTASALVMAPTRGPIPEPLSAPPTFIAEDGSRAPQTEPAAQDELTQPRTAREAVIARLEEWAAAWARQDVEDYLRFYAEDFSPSGRLGRSTWEAQRDQRLSAPEWIVVRLKDFDVHELAPGRIQVDFIQIYRSDRFSDRTRKRVVLVSREGEWRILSERTLKILSR